MKREKDYQDHAHLDQNLDRLLVCGGPTPAMPQELKARIRSRLSEVETGAGKGRSRPGRWAGWTMAAAAMLAFLLVLFWPGGSRAALSWADVLEQLETISTVKARTCNELTDSAGKLIRHWSLIYFKDPGFSRTELFQPDNDPQSAQSEIRFITITRRDPAHSKVLTLFPKYEQATMETHTFRSDGVAPPERNFFNLASESRNRLRRIAAEKTRPIGERVINGVESTGFQAPAREFFGREEGAANEGVLKVWVGRDDAVPLLIELEIETPNGPPSITTISDIQWNAPLEDSLFELIVPVDWRLDREDVVHAQYTATHLAPHVTLQIGPEEGDPLASTGDVINVIRGIQISHTDPRLSDPVQIVLELMPAAAQRLNDYAEAHPEELLVADFNGELTVATRLERKHPNRITFNLSLLGLSLAELESKYFTTTNEANES